MNRALVLLVAFARRESRLKRALVTLGGLVVLVAAAIVIGEINAWATCGVARIEAEGNFLRPSWMPRDEQMVREARKRAGQEAYDRCYKERWWQRDRDD